MFNWLKLRVNSIYILVYILGGEKMNEIVNIVSTVGFPIAMCGAIGYVLVFIIKKMLSQIDVFAASLDKFNNTLIVMDKRLEHIENKLNK